MLNRIAVGLNAAIADFHDHLRANKPTFSITDRDTGYKLHVKTPNGHEAWINIEVTNAEYSGNIFSDMVRFGLRQNMNVIGAQTPSTGE